MKRDQTGTEQGGHWPLLLFFITFTVSSFVFYGPPQKTHAQFVPVQEQLGPNLTANTQLRTNTLAKEGGFFGSGLDTIAWNVANGIIDQMTQTTISWINSGFDGSPAYVTDPSNYIQKAGEAQLNDFVEGYWDNRFGAQPDSIKEVVGEALVGHQGSTFEIIYNLDEYTEDQPDDFVEGDFGKGGWDAWFAMTQNRDNNIYGSYEKNLKEVLSNAVEAQEEELRTLNWGDGFLSFRDCVKDDSVGNCVVQGPVKTPGKVLEDQVNKTIGSGQRRLEMADEFNEILSALINQVVGQLYSESGLQGF